MSYIKLIHYNWGVEIYFYLLKIYSMNIIKKSKNSECVYTDVFGNIMHYSIKKYGRDNFI